MFSRVLLASAALAAALVTGTATAADAATTRTTTATGYDVSYPQCGSALPDRQDIAVVGVNAGTGTTTNPCLADQLTWGDAVTADGSVLRADVYVNTANPGHLGDWWPTADMALSGAPVVNPRGRCAGAENAACAYVYGYSVGLDDVRNRGVTDPAARMWWLDVETMNSWSWNRQANLAVLEGMAAAIRAGGGDVGIYSTQRQWNIIIGDSTPSVSLAGTPSWIAGATTRDGALRSCDADPLTPNGTVRMVQWVEHGIDHDVSCEVGVAGTRPSIDGAATSGGVLALDPGAWGPSNVTLRTVWTRDGVPIDGATGGSYSPTAADVGHSIAAVVTGSRLGAPSLTLTSAGVLITEPNPEPPVTPDRRAQWFTV